MYWLYAWLDARGATTFERARKLLNNPKHFESLQAAAGAALPELEAPRMSGEALVAGAVLDLAGTLDCVGAPCRLKRVDELLGKVWHYFDHVAIADHVARALAHRTKPTASLTRDLLAHARVALHLREIHADTLLVYQDKRIPQVCIHCWRKARDREAFPEAFDTAAKVVDVLAKEAVVERVPAKDGDDGYRFRLDHPYTDHQLSFVVARDAIRDIQNETEVRRVVADTHVGNSVLHLAADIAAARRANAALGSASPLHRRLLTDVLHETSESQVAFHLDLPIVFGIDTASLLRLRAEERDSFERFRRALRAAMRERVRAASGGSAQRVAKEIHDDVVAPEVARIRDRLTRSANAVGRKALIGASVGSLATTCGVIFGATPAVAALAGVTAFGTALYNAVSKHIDESNEARSSDMYFLWKAARHLH